MSRDGGGTQSAVPVRGETRPPLAGKDRNRALDGLRGLAVAAVLAHHGGISWARGGFLGVDAFFVLSGYLITTLLLQERVRTGAIGLASFWARRARRLLPALLVMVLVVCLVSPHLISSSDLAGLRGDALAALMYVANWRMVFRGTDYFAQTATPSLLQHTWSLGIEEQFYIVWPLLVIGVMRVSRGRSGRAGSMLLVISMCGVAASSALCGVLFRDPADLGRTYFGSDTRALALLVGCAVAILLARSPGHGLRHRSLLAMAAALGAVALAWLWSSLDGTAPFLYPGGLLAGSLATAALLTHVVTSTGSVAARIMSLPPLALLGRISYGVYLWHWPLFRWLSAERTGLDGVRLFGLRAAVTVVVAAVSFVLIELPVQRRSLRFLRRPLPALATSAVCLTLVAGTAISALPSGPRLSPSTATAPEDAATAFREHEPPTGRPPYRPTDRHPGTAVSTVIMGDSIAWSLLHYLPPTPGVTVHDITRQGCGLALGSPYRYFGSLHEVSRRCERWPIDLRQAVDRHDPDVVVILFGRWETMDREQDGRWTHIGDKAFDGYLRAQLGRAVETAAARGARVLLATEPYNRRGERPDGGLWPEDNPERVDRWNRMLRQVATHEGPSVKILDLAGRLCPDGAFTWQVDGVRVRSDGVHLTPEGARWLEPWLTSQLKATAG
ncbi:acyltransferase family protein [Streptomyces sp. NPDC006314]|uniref:acyltransferase family protein n=1 Tax=Streptomyces sp. NPDC006314 TaxID=3154475 RepID=UPI0033B34196